MLFESEDEEDEEDRKKDKLKVAIIYNTNSGLKDVELLGGLCKDNCLAIKCSKKEKKFIIASIYMESNNTITHDLEWLKEIKEHADRNDNHFVSGGDFNCILDGYGQKSSGTIQIKSSAAGKWLLKNTQTELFWCNLTSFTYR